MAYTRVVALILITVQTLAHFVDLLTYYQYCCHTYLLYLKILMSHNIMGMNVCNCKLITRLLYSDRDCLSCPSSVLCLRSIRRHNISFLEQSLTNVLSQMLVTWSLMDWNRSEHTGAMHHFFALSVGFKGLYCFCPDWRTRVDVASFKNGLSTLFHSPESRHGCLAKRLSSGEPLRFVDIQFIQWTCIF